MNTLVNGSQITIIATGTRLAARPVPLRHYIWLLNELKGYPRGRYEPVPGVLVCFPKGIDLSQICVVDHTTAVATTLVSYPDVRSVWSFVDEGAVCIVLTESSGGIRTIRQNRPNVGSWTYDRGWDLITSDKFTGILNFIWHGQGVSHGFDK